MRRVNFGQCQKQNVPWLSGGLRRAPACVRFLYGVRSLVQFRNRKLLELCECIFLCFPVPVARRLMIQSSQQVSIIQSSHHDSIKPAGLVRHGVAKFIWIQFGGWAAIASVASPNVWQLSANETGDYSPPSQTGFRQIWQWSRRPNRWLDRIIQNSKSFSKKFVKKIVFKLIWY